MSTNQLLSNYVLTYDDLINLEYLPRDINWNSTKLYGHLSDENQECRDNIIFKTDIYSILDMNLSIYRLMIEDSVIITGNHDLEFPYIRSNPDDIFLSGKLFCVEFISLS